MPSIDSTIQWYEDRKGKVTYSMTERRGPNSYDCSSALYFSLIQGGFLPSNIYIGNTDTLFNDLEHNGWVQLQPNAQGNFDTKRGDVFIWGIRGNSTGSLGHTGIFTDEDNIDHCSYGYNGIATSNYDWLHSVNGNVPQTFYRYSGTTQGIVNNPTDQVVEIGSYIAFDQSYTADDVQAISDVWQVRTNVLCPVGFTWADNGIPAAAVVEVDSDGYATTDQVLDIGSHYKIPGKFLVSDVGQSSGRWLAKIEYSGLSFWVDLETATEVSGDNSGTPVPIARPLPVPTISSPTAPQQPVHQEEPEKPPVVSQPQDTATQTPAVGNTGILQDMYTKLESNKTILTNIVITFLQTAGATWATTNFSMDRLALAGAIGAGFSAVYNLVLKPAFKALLNK